MHFGLASIKHRTNSFKVVVNIFFLLSSSSTSSSYIHLACVNFSLYALIDSRFKSSLFLFFLNSPLASSCPSTRQSRLRCASVSHKQMPLRTSHLVYNYVGFYNSPLLFRELYTIFLSIDPLGDAQFSCCFSEMKESLYQDDRSEWELQNQDIHDHCVRTESRHDELSSVQVRMSGL